MKNKLIVAVLAALGLNASAFAAPPVEEQIRITEIDTVPPIEVTYSDSAIEVHVRTVWHLQPDRSKGTGNMMIETGVVTTAAFARLSPGQRLNC